MLGRETERIQGGESPKFKAEERSQDPFGPFSVKVQISEDEIQI